MIYFVRQTNDTGPIKIGMSIKLSVRLRELCGEYKCDLRVVAVINGRRREEAELHRRFAHLRTGKYHSSEWFHPGAELLDFIEKEGLAWDGSDEVRAPPARLMALPLDVIQLARIAASYRGVKTVALLADILRPLLAEMVAEDSRKILKRIKD